VAAIARRYGAVPASIVAANKLSSGEAVEGDRLLIPVALRAAAPARTARATASRTPVRRPSTTRARTASSKSNTAANRPRKTPVIVARTTPR